MDQVIKSNNSSVLYRSMQEEKPQDLSYSTKPSFPILAKEYRSTQPQQQPSGTIAGSEVAFNLTKSNLWRGASIKTTYTVTAFGGAGSDSHLHGVQMFEWIQIRSNNRVLFQFSDYALRARLEYEDEAKAGIIQRMALPLVPTTEIPAALTGATALVTYTHLDCAFFESVKNHLDLNYYEQIQVVCKFNQPARAGFVQIISAASLELWSWKYQLDELAYQKLRAQNQRPEVPLNMYTYTTMTERQQCTHETQNTIRLNVNGPVFNTYIGIVNKTITIATGAQPFKIDSFEFSVGGTKLLESVPELVGKKEAMLSGASAIVVPTGAVTVTRRDGGFICINWGMNTRDRTYNSGGVSFNQINFPQVVINTQTLTTAANYDIVIVHEMAQITTLDNSNGSIINTVSS